MIKKNQSVVVFNKVSKRYFLQQARTLKEMIPRLFSQESVGKFIWALKELDFSVKKGETLGIIGNNGSGKSTLLKLVAGVTKPTQGKIEVKGKVSSLIQLGAGFHHELTGRENIYLNGSILGIKEAEIKKIFGKIVSFSELWDFIDTPLKHYSSGMKMRLGFSIAIHMGPEILLIDEVFAVGDLEFKKKCFKVLEKFKKQQVTMIIVSHSMEMVKNHCDRVFLVHGGRIVKKGTPGEVVKLYQDKFAKKRCRLKKK